MTAPHLFEVRDVRFSYKLGNQKFDALRGVSFSVPATCALCLQGPSGSGKTTLLNLLGLIEPVQEGEVLLDGQNLKQLSEGERNRIRRYGVGFVFQNFHLLDVLNAEENVEYFLARQGVPAPERRERVREALDLVGLWEHRRKKPREMSGGQRQRVAVARAFAKRPKLIIADEPTASLDQATGKSIMETMTRLHKESGVSLIVSSHDPMVQGWFSDRIVLCDGLLQSIPEHFARKVEG